MLGSNKNGVAGHWLATPFLFLPVSALNGLYELQMYVDARPRILGR